MSTPFYTGPNVRSGVGIPGGDHGFPGDFYIDQNDTNTFYGPKQAGVWGPLQRFAVPNAVTGLIGGMLMTKVSSTSIKITAGQGKIVDYVTDYSKPKITPVALASSKTITLTAGQLASAVTWWYIDGTGTIHTQTTRPQHVQRRQVIQLGAVTCQSNAIVTVTPAPTYVPQGTLQLYDLLYELGPFVAPPGAGNVISPNDANLSINKTAGVTFSPSAGYANGPNEVHYITNPVETPLTITYATRVAGSESATSTAFVDPTNYDNGGVVTAVGGNTHGSTIQRVFLVPTGVAGTQCVIQYGQAQYASLAIAVAAIGNETFVLNPDLDGTAALLAWIAVERGSTNLSGATAAIVRANRFVFP